MRKLFTRGLRLIAPFVLFALVLSCGTDHEKQAVKLDQIVSRLDTIEAKISRISTPAPIRLLKKHYTHKFADKERTLIQLCVSANFRDNKYDSLVILVTIVNKNGKSTDFGQLTFSKKFVRTAALSFVTKDKFDVVLTSAWYKAGISEDGNWCKIGTGCNETDSYLCSNTSAPVVSVKTTATGSSTATVSMDEQ